MRKRILIALAALALPALAAAQIVQADYTHTLSQFGGEPQVLETGSHFFGPDGQYRRDILRDGERMSEIVLLETGERITMNHDMRAAQRGLLDRLWEIPSRLIRPRPTQRLRPDIEQLRATSGVDTQRERLGRRTIGGLVVSGSRNTLTYPDGRQRIIETWLMPHGHADGLRPWPVMVEQTLLTLEADGSEIGREELRLVSTVQAPDPGSLFVPAGDYEVQNLGPRRTR